MFLYRYIFLYLWLELIYTGAMTWRINIVIQNFHSFRNQKAIICKDLESAVLRQNVRV